MSGQREYRLGDILGIEEPAALETAELESLIDGTMDPKRLSEIEARARKSPAWAELLDDVRKFRRLTESLESDSLALSLEAKRRSASRVVDSKSMRRPSWIAVGAATAAAVAVVAVILNLWSGLGPEPLFEVDARKAAWIDPPVTRSADPIGAAIRRAREAFESGALERAEFELDAALAQAPANVFALHDLGIVRLLRGNAPEAVEAFRRSDELQAVAPSQETRFWLAVSLSAAGRSKLACEMMDSAAEIPGERRVEARDLVSLNCPNVK